MTQAAVSDAARNRWAALGACLLDFQAFPGRYPLAMREPRLLFDHGTEVLILASGRPAEGMPQDEALRLESASFHDVGLTEDLAEGTTAFRERREARFKGR